MLQVIMMVVFVIVALAGVIAMICWNSHNRLMALDERCETAFSDIDVQLKHRHSVLPGLVETVRGFAEHERGIISEVARARASALRATGPEMRLEAETQLGQSINSILTMAESYPEIKASTDFRDLRRELVDTDAKIAAARRFYNMACNELNATLRQFPGVFIARFARVDARKRYDIGIERVMMDEPIAIKF
jgi:LemA protein